MSIKNKLETMTNVLTPQVCETCKKRIKLGEIFYYKGKYWHKKCKKIQTTKKK